MAWRTRLSLSGPSAFELNGKRMARMPLAWTTARSLLSRTCFTFSTGRSWITSTPPVSSSARRVEPSGIGRTMMRAGDCLPRQ